MSTDDHELLAAWTDSRNERAFRTLVDLRLPQVLATATRITGNPDLARDVAQQTFIRLATRPPRLDATRSLAAWLHVTTRSLAIDLVRSEESRRRREQAALTAHAMPEDPAADWSRLAPVIDELIAALPPADREVVILRFIEGHSHSHIGARFGLTENTARMRVTRALEKLRLLLERRGITTTTAALALALPACAAVPVPAGLADAITASSLANAAASSTSVAIATSALLMKKAVLIAALIAAAGIPVWHYATSRPQTSAPPVPGSEPANVGAPSRSPGNRPARPAAANQPSSAAQGLALARIADAAARDAALAAWAAGFTTNEAMVALIAALRAEPHSTAALRALIAPHLTRQWATVDGAACIGAYLSEGALFRRDPLDSNNDPFAARDSALTTPAANLFTLIAETNPAAFNAWLKTAPADLIPALLGDPSCATWQAWQAAAGTGEKAIRDIDPILAQNFHQSDFANLLAARDPDLLLRPALDGRDLGLNRRYYNGLLEELGANDVFSASLLKSHTPDQLWDIFDKVTDLSAGFNSDPRAPFLKLAHLELAARADNLEEVAAAATALPADYRQAALFIALLDSLDPAAGDAYWQGLNTIAKALNDTASKVDAVAEVTRSNFYADLRSRIATALAKEDLDAALEWTGSIRDSRNRASCLMRIAAQELKPGVNAWAAGEVGAEEADEHFTLHVEDRSVAPPLVREFSLPPVAGESLPQYYARLRAALKHQLE
jgi:RNA polymerase sigma factor (sigma-70 family)